jgi:hypothetical protein
MIDNSYLLAMACAIHLWTLQNKNGAAIASR